MSASLWVVIEEWHPLDKAWLATLRMLMDGNAPRYYALFDRFMNGVEALKFGAVASAVATDFIDRGYRVYQVETAIFRKAQQFRPFQRVFKDYIQRELEALDLFVERTPGRKRVLLIYG